MTGKIISMNMTDNQVIVSDAKAREEILNDLIENYKDMVFNLLYRMTHNYDDALELTQETFLKAYNALPGFRYESSLKTWVYKIALNLALNFRRKWQLFNRNESVQETEIRDTHASPEQDASDHQLSQYVQVAINKLPKDQRAMILLREIEELSYEEIADVLNVPLGTVKSRLARARCYLKKSLSQIV